MKKFLLIVYIALMILPAAAFAADKTPAPTTPADFTWEGTAPAVSGSSNNVILTSTETAKGTVPGLSIPEDYTWNFNGPNWYLSVGTLTCNGNLNSTGNMSIYAPSGAYVGPNANVNIAGSFILSTLESSAHSFAEGSYNFQHDVNQPYSQIVNEGTITANNVALIASAVTNSPTGIITATAGNVNLAAGNKATVSFDKRGLLSVEVTEATSSKVKDLNGVSVKDALLTNSGKISAANVTMTAKTASDIFENAINQSGIVKATKIVEEDGVIKIVANNDIKLSGVLEAESGRVEVTTDASIKVEAKLETTGDTTLSAKNDIKVNADIITTSGNLQLLADSNLDGVGSFLQAQGTTISTINYGDITIQSSGESTLANINAAGSLILKQAGSPATFTQYPGSVVNTSGSINIGNGVTVNASDTHYNIGRDWINSGIFVPQESTVSLVSLNDANVIGKNDFFNFTVTVPSKIVRFDPDNPIAILGTLTLKGSYAHLLTLTSIDPSKQWTINPEGQTDIQYALIGNCLNIRAPPSRGTTYFFSW